MLKNRSYPRILGNSCSPTNIQKKIIKMTETITEQSVINLLNSFYKIYAKMLENWIQNLAKNTLLDAWFLRKVLY
jgi:hypothetical protein